MLGGWALDLSYVCDTICVYSIEIFCGVFYLFLRDHGVLW